jgi:hypothetical protein
MGPATLEQSFNNVGFVKDVKASDKELRERLARYKTREQLLAEYGLKAPVSSGDGGPTRLPQ